MADASIAIALKFLDQASAPMKSAFGSIQSSAASVAGPLNAAFGLFVGSKIVGEVSSLAKSFVQAAAQMERSDLMLRQLTGSSQEAEQAFAWIAEQGSKAFGIEATTDAFVKFKAIGIDPTGGALVALEDALSAFGKNTPEALKLATVAVTQMAGKGVISMEELRQQLAEQIPTAAAIMARELGMSYGEMIDKIGKGALSSKEGLNALFTGLGKDYGGMTDKMGNTWDGLMSKMDSAWFLFKKEVMDSEGLFGMLKEGATELYNEIMQLKKDGTLKEWAADIASGVVNSFRYMTEAVFAFGTAVNNVRAAWYGLKETVLGFKLSSLEEKIQGIRESQYFESVEAQNKALAAALREREETTAAYADAVGGLSSAKDAEEGMVARYDQITAAIERIRTASKQAPENVTTAGFKPPEIAGGAGKAGGGGKSTADALKDYNRIMEEGIRIKEKHFTATEKYNAELERLEYYLGFGAISQETYSKAVEATWQDLVKAAEATDGWRGHLELIKTGEQVFADTRTEAEQYAAEIERLNYLLGYGVIQQDTYNRAVEAAEEKFLKTTDQMSEFAVEAAHNIQDTLGKTLKDVLKGDFENIGDAFGDMLADMAAQAMAAQIGSLLFGDFGKTKEIGGLVGGAISWIGGLFGGGMASGGSVSPGRTYLVGEKGPELFTPGSGGSITPNAQLSGAPSVSVNIRNETGSKVDAEQGQATFNGESWVANVTLKLAKNSPSYRNQMRQLLGR